MTIKVTDLFPTIAGTSKPISVADEGQNISQSLTSLNFVGEGVNVTGTSGATSVSIPGGGAGAGGSVVDWDMSSDVVVLGSVELSEKQNPSVPYSPNQTLTQTTLTSPIDTNVSFAGAVISEGINFSSPKWVLFRATEATGDFSTSPNSNGVFLFFGDPFVNPATSGGVSYSPATNELVNPLTGAVIDPNFNLNDWALVIFDPSVPETRVKTANVDVVVSTLPLTGQPIEVVIQGQTNTGTGSLALEVSSDPANLGTIDPGTANPIGEEEVVLPQDAAVGDILNVTVGGTYKGTVYSVGDAGLYTDDSPERVNRVPAISPISSTDRTATVPTDFATVPEALNYLKGFVYTPDTKGIIFIEDGYTLTSADALIELGEQDISWLGINTLGVANIDYTSASFAALWQIVNSKISYILGEYNDVTPGGGFRPPMLFLQDVEAAFIGNALSPLKVTNTNRGGNYVNVSASFFNVEETSDGNTTWSAFLENLSSAFSRYSTDGSKVSVTGDTGRSVVRKSSNQTFELEVDGSDVTLAFDGTFTDSGTTIRYTNRQGAVGLSGTGAVRLSRESGSLGLDLNVVVDDGFSAELDIAAPEYVRWTPEFTSSVFASLGVCSTLRLEDFNNTSVDTNALIPDAIFQLAKGSSVISSSIPGISSLAKGVNFTKNYARLASPFNDQFFGIDRITPDNCLVSTSSVSASESKASFIVSSSQSVDPDYLGTLIEVRQTITLTLDTVLEESVYSEFEVFNSGLGTVTLAAGTGVTLNSVSGNFNVANDGLVKVRRVDTNTWSISGDLTA